MISERFLGSVTAIRNDLFGLSIDFLRGSRSLHTHQLHDLIASSTIQCLHRGEDTGLVLLKSRVLPLLGLGVCVIECGGIANSIGVPVGFAAGVVEWG